MYYRTDGGDDICELCYRNGEGKPAIPIHTYDPDPHVAASLEWLMLPWASRHFLPAFIAYDRDDAEWRGQVMARMIRRRAEYPDGGRWIVQLARSRLGGELRAIAPTIVRAGGFPDDGQTFAEWIDATRAPQGVPT
jgi:hypothetical protein